MEVCDACGLVKVGLVLGHVEKIYSPVHFHVTVLRCVGVNLHVVALQSLGAVKPRALELQIFVQHFAVRVLLRGGRCVVNAVAVDEDAGIIVAGVYDEGNNGVHFVVVAGCKVFP